MEFGCTRKILHIQQEYDVFLLRIVDKNHTWLTESMLDTHIDVFMSDCFQMEISKFHYIHMYKWIDTHPLNTLNSPL